jgi:putative DNA primase/helicase
VPRVLALDPDAFALFDELRCEAMERAQSSRGLAGGWHGKTPGRALRFGLVYELLAWASRGGDEPCLVTADSMVRAGGYLDYLVGMLDRVTAGLAIGRADADAAVIARHIYSARLATLNERALYQVPGWSWLRDGEPRAAALQVLADAAWIRPAAPRSAGRPRGDWTVSPRLWEAAR